MAFILRLCEQKNNDVELRLVHTMLVVSSQRDANISIPWSSSVASIPRPASLLLIRGSHGLQFPCFDVQSEGKWLHSGGVKMVASVMNFLANITKS